MCLESATRHPLLCLLVSICVLDGGLTTFFLNLQGKFTFSIKTLNTVITINAIFYECFVCGIDRAVGTGESLFNMNSGRLEASLDRIETILTHTSNLPTKDQEVSPTPSVSSP